ncbi:MAG: MCE family protein [Deltaproteobacteria bacterium]|nr:MCE family protein [Deltaproteobacteria bacterium]
MESTSKKMEALLGLMVIGVLGLFVWLSFSISGSAPKNPAYYSFLFDSALGLSKDNAVSIAGVKIGVVHDIGIEGRLAKVTVAIARDVQIFDNGKAALRTKTLLGEKYIDLDPGAAPGKKLVDGAVIHRNLPTVEIDQVLRETARLVKSLNVITPPFEAAVARVDDLLKTTNGEKVSSELLTTITDAGDLVRELKQLVKGSRDDLSFILKLGKDRGPVIAQRLEEAAERLDKVLGAIDPADVRSASKKIKPTMENIDAVTEDMRSVMADFKRSSGRLETILVKVDKTLTRAEAINERTVREFLQVEGVRVNLIPTAKVERRVRKLRNESSPLPVP